MARHHPQIVDERNTTICGLPKGDKFGKPHVMSEESPQFAEIGERLLLIRTQFSDLTQRAWAERHGFNATQWNNWEKGLRRIPIESAERLCRLYGLTLDFLYMGRRDGLAESASKVL